jgi:methylmalonyl-CoA carboxyltransferase large subunit
MKTESAIWAEMAATLEGFRRELVHLGERVAALEAAASGDKLTRRQDGELNEGKPAHSLALAQGDGLSDELVLVISAAIAAFLGKKAHIRRIRLIGSTAWAQQGRVTIQASHALSVGHARSQQ